MPVEENIRVALALAVIFLAPNLSKNAVAQQAETGGISLGSDISAAQAKLTSDGFLVHAFSFTDPTMQAIAAQKSRVENRGFSDEFQLSALNGRIILVIHNITFEADKLVPFATLRSQVIEKYGTPQRIDKPPGRFQGFWLFEKPPAVPVAEALEVCQRMASLGSMNSYSEQGGVDADGVGLSFNAWWPRFADAKCPKEVEVSSIGFTKMPEMILNTELAGGVSIKMYDGTAYFNYLNHKSDAAAAAEQKKVDDAGKNKAKGL